MSPLPHDLEAEVAFLVAAVADPGVSLSLRPEDFFSERHRTVYESLRELREDGIDVTPVSLADSLRKRGRWESVGFEGVSELFEAMPSTGASTHARIIRDKAQMRRLIHACQSTIRDAMEGQEATADVLTAAERRLLDVTETRETRDGFRPVSEAVHEAMVMIERAAEAKGGIVGFRTGIPKLDQMTSGLERGGLTVLAARPAMGKSAKAWQLAERFGMDHLGVLVASYEMSGGQLGRRGISRLADVDSQRVRKGQLTAEEWKAIAVAANRISTLPIWINDHPPHQVEQLRSQVHRHRSRHQVDVVIVDYLQQMSGPQRAGNRNNEIEHISRGLKRMARELDVHVIALAQLSRGVESRTPPRPVLSDLRDSGAIEQDADNVLLLWRPEYYFDDKTPPEAWNDWQGRAELIVAKQRDGETGRILLEWDAPRLMFTESENQRDIRHERRRRAG